MNSRNFFGELRRRNVFRVAVVYAVVGWLIIQIATAVFPVLEIPHWCVRLVVVLLLLGFPWGIAAPLFMLLLGIALRERRQQQ